MEQLNLKREVSRRGKFLMLMVNLADEAPIVPDEPDDGVVFVDVGDTIIEVHDRGSRPVSVDALMVGRSVSWERPATNLPGICQE